MKRCTKCGCLKSLTEFVTRTDREGYYTWCRTCQATHGRECGWPLYYLRGAGTADGGMKLLEEKFL